jgi:arsenite-transporting ATPase
MRIGGRGREVVPNLQAVEIDPEQQVDRYLDAVKRTMRDFVRPAMYEEIDRQIALTRESPGAIEAALMEEIARLMDAGQREHDQVIFDTAPTGHTLRLLALPEIMTAWMDGLLRSRERSESFGRAIDRLTGKRAEQGDDLSWFQESDDAPDDPRARKIRELLMERRRTFSRARRALLDPDVSAFLMVLIPEKLPVLETRKAVEVLLKHGVPIAGLVVNRVLPDAPLGDFLESRRAQEGEYLARIDRLFGEFIRIRVPLLSADVQGLEGLRDVARYLPVA